MDDYALIHALTDRTLLLFSDEHCRTIWTGCLCSDIAVVPGAGDYGEHLAARALVPPSHLSHIETMCWAATLTQTLRSSEFALTAHGTHAPTLQF